MGRNNGMVGTDFSLSLWLQFSSVGLVLLLSSATDMTSTTLFTAESIDSIPKLLLKTIALALALALVREN
jgi:hypothetical protein